MKLCGSADGTLTCRGQVPHMTPLQQQPHIYHPSYWVIDFIFAISWSICLCSSDSYTNNEINHDYGYREGNARLTQVKMFLGPAADGSY